MRKEILERSIGSCNKHGVKLVDVVDREGAIRVQLKCPDCGQEYEISWTRFSLTKRCADCYYQSKYKVKKHRVREIGEMSNKRLAEILDPQAIWKRMVNRNPVERREELDEIALGRKV